MVLNEQEKKKVYEEPVIEITEFSFEESIAVSGAGLAEEIWKWKK